MFEKLCPVRYFDFTKSVQNLELRLSVLEGLESGTSTFWTPFGEDSKPWPGQFS